MFLVFQIKYVTKLKAFYKLGQFLTWLKKKVDWYLHMVFSICFMVTNDDLIKISYDIWVQWTSNFPEPLFIQNI